MRVDRECNTEYYIAESDNRIHNFPHANGMELRFRSPEFSPSEGIPRTLTPQSEAQNLFNIPESFCLPAHSGRQLPPGLPILERSTYLRENITVNDPHHPLRTPTKHTLTTRHRETKTFPKST